MKVNISLEHPVINSENYIDANGYFKIHILFKEWEGSQTVIDLYVHDAINLVQQIIHALACFVDMKEPSNFNRINRILSDAEKLYHLLPEKVNKKIREV